MDLIDANLTAEKQRATITVNGKSTEIHAKDVRKSILAAMEEDNLDVGAAWDKVQLDMARMLGGGKAPVAQTDLFRAAPITIVSGTVTLDEPAAQPGLVAAPHTGRIESESSTASAHVAQDEQGTDGSAAAQPLRGEALRAMALAQKDGDLHPQARLLGEVAPEDEILDKLQPTRVTARQQALQLGLRFPQTPAGRSAFPADVCRTSIFHVASNNVPRRDCQDEFMGQVGANISVMYNGSELRHDDERVLMQLIQLAQDQPPWSWIEISTIPFARAATGSQRKLGKTDAEQVEQSLWRLRKGLITLSKDRNFIPFNPIKDLMGSGSKRLIQLDPRMVLLFNSSYVLLDDKLYHETRGIERQIFKYLHTNPYEDVYPVKIQTLFELCYGTIDALQVAYAKENPGKPEKDARRAILKKVSDFRKKGLPAALIELKKKEVLASYSFSETDDKVSFKKGPVFAQYARRELQAS
ncbi:MULTISPECIES: plasmid replication initiator TrfA [Cupriavidus]